MTAKALASSSNGIVRGFVWLMSLAARSAASLKGEFGPSMARKIGDARQRMLELTWNLAVPGGEVITNMISPSSSNLISHTLPVGEPGASGSTGGVGDLELMVLLDLRLELRLELLMMD